MFGRDKSFEDSIMMSRDIAKTKVHFIGFYCTPFAIIELIRKINIAHFMSYQQGLGFVLHQQIFVFTLRDFCFTILADFTKYSLPKGNPCLI